MVHVAHAEQAIDLKNQVAIVRPEITEEHKAFAKEMSTALSAMNYYAVAKEYQIYSNGWFGSGFIVKGKDGKNYIITNKHVTKKMKEVSLEFTGGDSPTIFHNCPVIMESKDVDLAIVALPEDYKKGVSFDIQTDKVGEGDDVWSAGYPGLGKNPVWQLGKGIISNMNVRDKEFGDEKKVSVIQHTAQVDGGNSGGPLLIRHEKEGGEVSYTVIGINTWKAGGRENTNFSIPVKFANDLIEQATGKKDESEQDLGKVAKSFHGALLTGYNALIPYISDEYIYNAIKRDDFKAMYNNASTGAKSEAQASLSDKDGDKAARILFADFIHRSVAKKKETLTLQNTQKNDDGTSGTTTFLYRGKEKKFNWKKENGQWKVISSSFAEANAKKAISETETGVHINRLEGIGIQLNSMIGMNDYAKFDLEFGFHRYFAGFGMYGLNLSAGKDMNNETKYVTLPIKDPYYNSDYTTVAIDTISDPKAKLALSYNIGAGLPIGINSSFVITPYIYPGIGTYITPFGEFFWEFRGGSRFGWQYNKDHQLYLGVEYIARNVNIFLDEDKIKRKYLGISIGLDF